MVNKITHYLVIINNWNFWTVLVCITPLRLNDKPSKFLSQQIKRIVWKLLGSNQVLMMFVQYNLPNYGNILKVMLIQSQ